MQTNPLNSQQSTEAWPSALAAGFASRMSLWAMYSGIASPKARETPSLAQCDEPVSGRILSRLSAQCSSDWFSLLLGLYSLSFAQCLCASAVESPRYAPTSQHPEESASAKSNHLFLRCLKSDRSSIETPPVGEIINIKHPKVMFGHLHMDEYGTFTTPGKPKRSAAVAYSQEIHYFITNIHQSANIHTGVSAE